MPDAGAVTVARALLEAGTITLRPADPVTFKSGLRSPVYVDARRLISNPGPWRTVIEAFADRLPAGDDIVIAGVEAAGIPHSSALAFATGRPSVFVRKAAKEHGLGRRVEGGDVSGRMAVLVEDMVTTGGSSLSAIAALRSAGATVETCLATITYGFREALAAFEADDCRLEALTSFDTVIDLALEDGTIERPTAELVRAWLADPYRWQPA